MNAPGPVDRRTVVRTALAALAVTMVAPGMMLIEVPTAAAARQGARATRRWGLLIDLERCAEDCSLCVDACSREHGWHAAADDAGEPRWIRQIEAADPTSGRRVRVPLMCQHCADPPCADVCPTSATFRRADGIVLVDRHICIGCRYCVMACPFGVRFFVGDAVHDQRPHSPRGQGTAEGCTLCVHRVDHGGPPACVEACATTRRAMTFGDLEDPDSPIRIALADTPSSRLRSDLALAQGVRYHGL